MQVLAAQVEYIDSVSDKFYRSYVGIYPNQDGWCVYQWGRRGVLGQSKLEAGQARWQAEDRAYNQLRAKCDKGYRTTYDQLRLELPNDVLLSGNARVPKSALEVLDAAFVTAAEAQWGSVLGMTTSSTPDQVVAICGARTASKTPGSARALAELEAAWPHADTPDGSITLFALPKKQALLLLRQTWGPWAHVEVGGDLPKDADAAGVLDAAAALTSSMGVPQSVEAGLLLVAS